MPADRLINPSPRRPFGGIAGTLAAFAVLVAASVANAATHVKDDAQMFSAQAAQQAESQLAELQQRNGKLVVIETMTEPPPAVQQKIVADASKRNAVLLQLAGERRQAANADVYVLLNKTPGNFQLVERRELQSTGLPASERTQVQEAMLNAFKQKQFDAGLTTGVSMLVRSLADATPGATPNVPPAQTQSPQPRRENPTTPTAPPTASASRGLMSGGCCMIIGIGLLIVIVFTIVRRFSNRGAGPGGAMQQGGYPAGNPQQPQGGYPPQYPQQQQGGGFGRGMAGGVLGGVLGSVLGNQMSRGHDGGGHSSDVGGGHPTDGGGSLPTDTGSVGGGGDFDSSSNDTGSVGGGGDFGGGDSGGGGGDSGGGGGDF